MVFRFIRSLLNNEQVIRELSESRPIRLLARFIVRGAAGAQQKFEDQQITRKLDNFKHIFKEEYKKAIESKK